MSTYISKLGSWARVLAVSPQHNHNMDQISLRLKLSYMYVIMVVEVGWWYATQYPSFYFVLCQSSLPIHLEALSSFPTGLLASIIHQSRYVPNHECLMPRTDIVACQGSPNESGFSG